MANKFITAIGVHADANSNYSSNLTSEFWEAYEKKLQQCSFNDEKKKQLTANLKETSSRLFDQPVAMELSPTPCTWWENDDLWFKPSAINTKKIREEQRSSFLIMHSKPDYCRIRIVIDLSETSWTFALRTTHAATFENIVDGLRLWSCLPHSVDQIFILKPNQSIFHSLFNFITPRILSVKLQKRMRVCSNVKEILGSEHDGS
jgi:hypothetical protein